MRATRALAVHRVARATRACVHIRARHYITLASSISANFHLRTLKIFMHHLDISPKRPANFGLIIPIGMEVLIGIGFPNRGGLFYIYRY